MSMLQDRLSAIRNFIGQQVENEGAGLALGLADATGQHMVFAGLADLESGVPITADTVFHVASLSKQFTAYAVALLARDGKVDLDGDIREWLPWLPDYDCRITPLHLIRHTSGISDQWQLFRLGGRQMTDHLTQEQIRSMLSRQLALAFPTGSAFRYCNSGYSLLAEIVATVSGRSFRQFCAEEVFEPLGMTSSGINDDAGRLVPRRANSYAMRAGEWTRCLLNFANYGATSLLTTLPDLLIWGRSLLDDGRPKPLPLAKLAAPGTLDDGRRFRYGFGLTSHDIAGRPACGHSGADAGFRAHFAVFPADGLTAVVLCNTPLPAAHILEAAVALWLDTGTTTYPLSETRPPATETDLPDMAGTYLHPNRLMLTIAVDDGNLVMRDTFGDSFPIRLAADGAFDTGAMGYGRFRVGRDESGGLLIHTDVPDQWAGERYTYQRIVVAKPPVPELRYYAGAYRCAELDASVTVSVVEDKLTASGIFLGEVELRPSLADRFDASGGLHAALVFVRDEHGRAVAFRSVSERHDNVIFTRECEVDG